MTEDVPPTDAKRAHFRRLLEDGIATLHLDPRVAGVEVPAHLRDQAMLLLNYSWRYHLDDFAFEGDEVIASLSFQGVPFLCVVPWRAVFAITDPRREGQVWPDALPPELRDPPEQSHAEDLRPSSSPRPAPPVAAGLRVLPGGREPDESTPPSPPPTRPHLRRVK